jgi:uncharacterized protein (TIGR03437 family)
LKLSALFVCLGALCPGFAQNAAFLTTAGYSAPAPAQVAPGQVTTFFFRGISPAADGHLRSAQATAAPLPATLAGLTLRISQGQANAIAVPLFAVRQESDCDNTTDVSAACLVTLVKLQIPFEIAAQATAGPTPPTLAPLAQLTLDVDGQASRAFPLQPVPDNAHVVTSCDISWDTKYTSICDRHVYHGDGHPVSAAEPAKQGETLVVYAYGLGQGTPQAPTGDVARGSVLDNVPGRVKASFDNLVNALNSGPRFLSFDVSAPDSPIAFGGLTSGQIGLYQLNIPVPQSLSLEVACGGLDGFVRSNATLHISTSQGTEVVAFCVQP